MAPAAPPSSADNPRENSYYLHTASKINFI
ncbi:unknown [Prevotella sp. CAG:873]|nr:unknown [Prevotella sp. CAG:873]